MIYAPTTKEVSIPIRWRRFCRLESRPPDNATSRFVGLGDKGWDSFKNFFQTQGFEFSFCPKGRGERICLKCDGRRWLVLDDCVDRDNPS